MNENELLHLLSSHMRFSTKSEIVRLTDSTFRVLDRTDMRLYAAKVIDRTEGRGTRGITESYRRSEEIKQLVQPVRALIETGRHTIALLDWIAGESLRETNRELLPAFFSTLRKWHNSNRNVGPIYSPYTRMEYRSIGEFVAAEVSLHLKEAKLTELHGQCIEALYGLNHGFITVIHGDVHPGNIQYADGQFILLDPEYVHCGINVLDLDYVEYGTDTVGEAPWWEIRMWAHQCIQAYFAGDDLSEDQISEIMYGIKMLTLLRSITNSFIYSTGNTEDAIRRFREELRSDRERMTGQAIDES